MKICVIRCCWPVKYHTFGLGMVCVTVTVLVDALILIRENVMLT